MRAMVKIAFGSQEETNDGVWSILPPAIRHYNANIIKNNQHLKASDGTNDDVIISNQISIIADDYAFANVFSIIYVEWRGVRWKISSIDIQMPRLILTLGGVWNGQAPETTKDA